MRYENPITQKGKPVIRRVYQVLKGGVYVHMARDQRF